jgi:hypothetical protein
MSRWILDKIDRLGKIDCLAYLLKMSERCWVIPRTYSEEFAAMPKRLSSFALFLAVGTAAQPAWALQNTGGGDVRAAPAPQAPGKGYPSMQAPGKSLPAPQAPGKALPAPQAPGKARPAGQV